MQTSLPTRDFSGYVARQMDGMFPDGRLDRGQLERFTAEALLRLEHCLRHCPGKYAGRAEPAFNHLNTDQYAAFLYFLSNSIHRGGGDPALAGKAYALNKAMHGLDVFYEVELPDIFQLVHPVGTVIGRGQFSDYAVIYQNVTIGAGPDGVYPRFGRGVVLYGGSRVVGHSRLGDNVLVAAGTSLIDTEIPGGSVAFGQYPHCGHKPTRHDVIQLFFGGASAPT